jgi:hypothetical protein
VKLAAHLIILPIILPQRQGTRVSLVRAGLIVTYENP